MTKRFSTEFEYKQVQFHFFAGPNDPVFQITFIISDGINVNIDFNV